MRYGDMVMGPGLQRRPPAIFAVPEYCKSGISSADRNVCAAHELIAGEGHACPALRGRLQVPGRKREERNQGRFGRRQSESLDGE